MRAGVQVWLHKKTGRKPVVSGLERVAMDLVLHEPNSGKSGYPPSVSCSRSGSYLVRRQIAAIGTIFCKLEVRTKLGQARFPVAVTPIAPLAEQHQSEPVVPPRLRVRRSHICP